MASAMLENTDEMKQVKSEIEEVKAEIKQVKAELQQPGLSDSDKGYMRQEKLKLLELLSNLQQKELKLMGQQPADLSPADLLSSALPPATRAEHGIKACGRSKHEFRPMTLERWTLAQPDEPNGSSLLAAIQEHQRDANNVYPGNLRLEPPRKRPVALNSESDVAHVMRTNILDLVQPLAQTANDAGSASWQEHPPSHLIEQATRYYFEHSGPMPGADAKPVVFSSWGRPLKPRQGGDEAVSTAACSTSTKRKVDFALEVDSGEAADPQLPGVGPGDAASQQLSGGGAGGAAEPQLPGVGACEEASQQLSGSGAGGAADQEPPSKRRKVVCVGEVKAGLTWGVEETPLDLLDAYHNRDHEHHNVAVAVIAHVFTYMQLWHLQYSFISSWFATWLVHCPPRARTTLYISSPFKAADTNPTPQASVAWLQKQALDKRHVQVDCHPPPPSWPLGPDGGRGGVDTTDGDHDSLPDAGAQQNSDDSSYKTESRMEGSTTHTSGSKFWCMLSQEEPVAAPCDTVLLERICSGDAGSVLHARYQGAPAVIKLFGPGNSAPFYREVQAYETLQQYQGTLLPRVLGSGYLAPGVLFIALSVVNGDTLDSLGGNTYRRAATAALQALTTLHTVAGFLHGDVHLRNIMLVRNGTDDDTAATCVFIDLGRAQLGAPVEKQQTEREQLRRRLKA